MDLLKWFTTRIYGTPSWPPVTLVEDWTQRREFRRRFHNDLDEMRAETPRFHKGTGREDTYTPVPTLREMSRFSAALLFSDPVKVTLPNEEEEQKKQREAKRQAEKDARNPFKPTPTTENPASARSTEPTGVEQSKTSTKPSVTAKVATKTPSDTGAEDQQAQAAAVDVDLEPPKSPLQIKLEELLDANDLDPFLQESAEVIGAEGRGGIVVARDEEIDENIPFLTFLPEDRCLWDVRYGRKIVGGIAVYEHAPPPADGGYTREVYRMFEEHKAGTVDREVWKGGPTDQGTKVERGKWPEVWKDVEEHIDTGLDVPLMYRWDNVPGGYSDGQGLSVLLDRLDEAESGMVDKERKTKPVVVASKKLSDENGEVNLEGVVFAGDENFDASMMDPSKSLIDVAQPVLMAEDHIDYIDHVRAMIVQHAGYSSATWGIGEEGRTDSGTALQLRQARTLLTRAGKERMATDTIARALGAALAWYDRDGAEVKVKDYIPDVALGIGLPTDPVEKANELSTRKTAGIVSLRQAVRESHPDWSEDQVDEEVDLIEGDTSLPPMIEAAMDPEVNPNAPFAKPDEDKEETSSDTT